jgi:hypothetical protein
VSVIDADDVIVRQMFGLGALEWPAIMWAGLRGELFLHPSRAVDLHFRVARDIREARHRVEHAALGLAGPRP